MTLLVVLASAALLHDWSAIALRGWTRDGATVAWEATMQSREKPDGVVPCSRVFLVVTDPEGRALGVYRLRSQVPMEEVTWIDEATDSLWKASGDEGAAQSWLLSHPLLAVSPPHSLRSGFVLEGGHEKLRVIAKMDSPHSCPTARLRVTLGSAQADMAADACRVDDAAGKGFTSTVQAAWAPDGRHAALAWNTTRPTRHDEVTRGHIVVVSPAALGHGRH